MFSQPAAGLQVPIIRRVFHPCSPAPMLYSSTRGVTCCGGGGGGGADVGGGAGGGGAGGGAGSVQVGPCQPIGHLVQLKWPKISPQTPPLQGSGLHGPLEPSSPPYPLPALGSGKAASPLRKRHSASVSPSAKSNTLTSASFPWKFRVLLRSARVPRRTYRQGAS